MGKDPQVDFGPDATKNNRVKKSCALCEKQVTGSQGISVSTNSMLPAEQFASVLGFAIGGGNQLPLSVQTHSDFNPEHLLVDIGECESTVRVVTCPMCSNTAYA